MKYAVISDIHEDIAYLRLSLNKIKNLGCDAIICLGDISGYNVRNHQFLDIRNASLCLEIVQENCLAVVAGNHDLHAIKKTPETDKVFRYPDNWYSLDYAERLKLAHDNVWLYDSEELDALYTAKNRAYLETLPEYWVLDDAGQQVFFSHFIYPNLTGSARMFYSIINDFNPHREFVAEKHCTVSFAGHRHFAGLFIASGTRMIKKPFNRAHTLKPGDVVLVPPIVRSVSGNGFCIFDTEKNTVVAKRI